MLREEMKKIWQPRILAALVLIGVVFYMMSMMHYIRYFPNGPNMQAEFDIAVQLIDQYGTTLEPAEFEEFKKTYPLLMNEMDAYIADYPLAQKYGYQSFADYQSSMDHIRTNEGMLFEEEKERYSDGMRISNYLSDGATDNVYGKVYATDLYIRQYERWQLDSINPQKSILDDGYSQQEYDHILRNFQEEAWQNILPNEIPQATAEYASFMLVWMMLSACLLISPVLVRDRMRSMRPLQWSTKRGRGTLGMQFAAAMLSTFLLCSVNLLVMGGLFATNHVDAFANGRMMSFMLTGYTWLNITYGQWCMVLIGMSYLICFGTTSVAFTLARFSTNYIAMLLKLIPLLVIAVTTFPKLIRSAFYFKNSLYQLTQIPMIELIATGVILILGISVAMLGLLKQKKQDLLTV